MPTPRRPVLVAPDSFKGTLRACEVAAAIGRGLERGGWLADGCPVADGGEGTREALLLALGGESRAAEVQGPRGEPLTAPYALLAEGGVAVVEVAAASGLALLDADERDAEAATTRGAGELMLAAARDGAEVLLVAAGGSASTDGGAGALEAIDEAGGLGGVTVVVLCDVRTPFEQAARRFAPQKGADADAVERLHGRLQRMAARLPRDPRGHPMTGAAGGLAGGLWAVLGARLRPGGAFVLEQVGFDERLRSSHAVIVGEGRLDRTTLEGKIAAEVAVRARQAGVPAHAVVGANAMDAFDARILDLGWILEAGTLRALERAGEQLAGRL